MLCTGEKEEMKDENGRLNVLKQRSKEHVPIEK